MWNLTGKRPFLTTTRVRICFEFSNLCNPMKNKKTCLEKYFLYCSVDFTIDTGKSSVWPTVQWRIKTKDYERGNYELIRENLKLNWAETMEEMTVEECWEVN